MMDFVKAGELIALYEKEYFSGAFCERVIRDDLGMRRGKKNFYIDEYTTGLDWINAILDAVRTHQSWDSMLISRCEKCRDQANKLLNIARGF